VKQTSEKESYVEPMGCMQTSFKKKSKPDATWKINSSPLKIRSSQKESHLPTIHFQVLLLMDKILQRLGWLKRRK